VLVVTSHCDTYMYVHYTMMRKGSRCRHRVQYPYTLGSQGISMYMTCIYVIVRTSLQMLTSACLCTSSCLTFLGIELDTVQMCLRLPQERLTELLALLVQWEDKKFCWVQELCSLTEKLQHACKVVRPGRTFLQRMFDLLKGTSSRRQSFVRLNVAFRSDLAWWKTFLQAWNGVSMLMEPSHDPLDVDLFTDASGGLGCGAWSGTSWFQYF